MEKNSIKRKIHKIRILLCYYIALIFVRVFNVNHNETWLISERGDEAKDNGYAFYKYLINNHPEIDVKYVITKNSLEYPKIRENDVIRYKSFKHYVYYITAKYLISTHMYGTAPDFYAFRSLDNKGLIHCYGKQIFLQHGITKDLIPIMNKNNNPKLDLFICGAKAEYEYLSKKLGYSNKAIKYTGFSRFDYLIDDSKNQILLMPTWRTYLQGSSEEEFEHSDYYKRYQSLINNDSLTNCLKDNGINLIFYPHYETQRYLKYFKTNSDMIKIASKDEYDVQTLLRESKLLITDYSSVFFDFAYMKKPVIYYQFDYEKYRETQYPEGYFSYKRDGFGPVFDKENQVVDSIRDCMKMGFVNDGEYLKRENEFFELHDMNNGERIYKEIIKL